MRIKPGETTPDNRVSLLTVPAVKFDFGGEFSPQTQRGIANVLKKIEVLLLNSPVANRP